MSRHPLVRIRYRRPPDRLQIFEQRLVHDGTGVKVTLADRVTDVPLMRIEGTVVLEPGSSVVWFTFPGVWHDIGRFHRADDTFTGLYANVLTPPAIDGVEWDTTDLFLDVWVPSGGTALLLDEDELDQAMGREWIDAETAERATAEAQRMMDGAAAGSWPPPVVSQWTLERCRGELAQE